jgi:hypothetical protein
MVTRVNAVSEGAFKLMFTLAAGTTLVGCGHATPARDTAGIESADPIRCQPHGNALATGAASSDVPLVTLYERDTWHSGFDVPTLLIWADGSVVYSEGKYGESLRLMQAASTTWQVREIVQSTISRLRDAPLYTEITNATDQMSVEIIFRDGEAWRDVDVYGLTREVTAKDVPEHVRDIVGAYHALLDSRPASGVPAPTTYRRPERWPVSLPTFRGQFAFDDLVFCGYRAKTGKDNP